MALVKFRTHTPAVDPFHNLFDELFTQDPFIRRNNSGKRNSLPAVNINEKENSFEVQLAAPGMNKSDFNIEVVDDVLTIRSDKNAEKKEENQKFTLREFSYNSFERSFKLPESVQSEDISATYTNGILSLSIPKKELVEQDKTRKIEVK